MTGQDPANAGEGGAAVLDAGALAQLRELDPRGVNRLLERVVQAFDASTSRLVPQLQAAGASGELEPVRHAVHTLKSSSASLGAMELSQLCAGLEHQIRTDAVVDLEAQIEAIVVESARVQRALSRLVGPPP